MTPRWPADLQSPLCCMAHFFHNPHFPLDQNAMATCNRTTRQHDREKDVKAQGLTPIHLSTSAVLTKGMPGERVSHMSEEDMSWDKEGGGHMVRPQG